MCLQNFLKGRYFFRHGIEGLEPFVVRSFGDVYWYQVDVTDCLPLSSFSFLPFLLNTKAFPERERLCRVEFQAATRLHIR
jgi:hypothetical protein